MTSLATVFVDGRVDTSRFGSDIRSGMTSSSVTSSTNDAGKATGSRFSSAFGNALKIGATLGAAFAVTKGVTFFKDSIAGASDLNESINALGVTYKRNADEVGALGEEAATSLGLSNAAFNSLAVQFSAFSKTVAGSRGDTVGVLDDLTTRAADFASVMNLDVNEAAGLFQSGLAGETEPLRKYGLDLSAAAVEQQAFKTGIAETGATLTEQQKVQARYSLLMSQTAKTQGDFKGTSDELANSQRILSAQFDDAQAKLGKALLPYAKDFVNLLRDKGIPAVEDFGEWFKQDGIPAIKDFGEFIADLGDELRPLLDTVVDFGGAVGDLPGPVKKMGAEALIAVVAFSKLRSATAGMGLPAFASQMRTAEGRTKAFGSAAKTAAGAGGLMLLIDGLDEGGTAAGELKTTLGAAAIGFSVGGPWGGAIGFAIGALKSYADRGDDAAASQEHLDSVIATLTQTLNEQTGALTAASKAQVLEDLDTSGILDQAEAFDISKKLILNYALGVPSAIEKMNSEIARIIPAKPPTLTAEEYEHLSLAEQAAHDTRVHDYEEDMRNFELFRGAVSDQAGAVQQTQKEWRENQRLLGLNIVDGKAWHEVIAGLPKEAKTAFRVEGMEITEGKVNQLLERYDLAKEDVVALVKALGMDKAKFDIDAFVAATNTSLGNINDEPVNVKLTTAATNVMGQVIDILDPFEFGGKVSGGTPGKDSVRAILTPDEHVWTVDEVAGAGGHATVAALRRMAKRGELGRHGDLTPFAEGGPVLASGSTGFGAAIGTITGLFGRVASALTSALSDKLSKALVHMPTAGQLGPGGTLTPAQLVRGQTFAKGEVGKPYIWGGVGPAGYDCSGFLGATLNAARGVNPYQRLGSTGTMPWAGSSPGVGRYTMGWSTNVGGTGIGHTAGNIGGLNVESYGGHGPAVGSGARGPLDPMFYGLMHYDSGGILGPGYTMAFNGTGKNETIRTGDQEQKINDAFNAIVEGIGKSGHVTRAVQEAAKSLKGLQKAADKAEAHLQRSEDHLSGLLSAEKDLSRSIAQGFDTTVFGEGAPSTARDLMQQARAEVNDAELFEHVLKQLKAHGANPGLLRALASAGPGAIVQAQALAGLSRKELNRYQHVLAAGSRAERGLGNFVGDEVYDDRVQEARKDVRHLTRALDELKDRLGKQAKDTGDEVANALDHTAVRLDGRLVGELLTRRQDRRNRGG